MRWHATVPEDFCRYMQVGIQLNQSVGPGPSYVRLMWTRLSGAREGAPRTLEWLLS